MQLKVSDKPFKKWDIAVYAVLIIFTAVLFLSVYGFKTEEGNGFTVALSGRTVMTGNFDDGSYYIADYSAVSVNEDGTFTITSEKGYNVLSVDWQSGDVKVTDTDCGTSKECTFMSLKSGAIICVPHGLTVSVIGKVPDPEVG